MASFSIEKKLFSLFETLINLLRFIISNIVKYGLH
ncbi:MAG: hypothetical protein RI964_1610 [Pseudomonadota bacterium]|jgi:hypothetical protein